ncbi:MAG: acyl-CoA dehydrogenase family protein, partial [Alphaproteobacteria bacterium]|nr:acyl-CoA dehydrogenase family protein [Alphaproteobacteria bacterium]
MDFNDSPEEAEFRADARKWIKENAPDVKAAKFVRDDEGVSLAKEWQKRKYDGGWACLHWPKEYGGRDATPIERVIWSQEEGDLSQLSGVFTIGHGMCGPTIIAHGTDEQKDRYLNKMASGEEIWCQLFSEPGSGSDLAGLRTKAVKDGDEW